MAAAEMTSDYMLDCVIRNRIAELEDSPVDPRTDLPFIVADSSKVLQQHRRWVDALPRIQPFYAIKCNPDARLVKFLADLGLGFDCASLEEIQLVLDLGIDPSRIVFSHPCKAVSTLRMASDQGVMLTTFDNLDELEKIDQNSPEMRLLLRIYAHDDTALGSMGKKFGAGSMDDTQALLTRAAELGLQVVGISFHIGTAASDPKAFSTAVRHAGQTFDQGKNLGFDMMILDVGGGFQDSNFGVMSSALQRSIDQEFPEGVRVIAEPGRFYARRYYTMVCKVISRRKQIDALRPSKLDMLYQNDGVYGCFMNKLIEDELFVPSLIRRHTGRTVTRNKEKQKYSIWGPTCDGIDCVADQATFDGEVNIGDWLQYPNMGAYTVASSTNFNGFPNSYDVVYVSTDLPFDAQVLSEEKTDLPSGEEADFWSRRQKAVLCSK